MQETGKVVSVKANRAEVEVEARGECEHCGAHGICNWNGNKLRRVLAVNKVGAVAGDAVTLEMVEGTGVKSNLLVFGVPTGFMFVGVLVGGLVMKKDLWAGILAGIGLAVGVAVVKVIDVAVNRSGRTLPVVVRRLNAEECKGVKSEEVADSDSGDSRGDSRQ